MRQFTLAALLAMALAGCASTAPYGNFATHPPAGLEERIAKGYALVEVKASPQEAAPPTAPGLSLHYVLDAVASPNLYRVTVMVGQKSLSRAYLAQNNRVAPAGAWVRKE